LRDFAEHGGLHLEVVVALGTVFDAEEGGRAVDLGIPGEVIPLPRRRRKPNV
jgi:hypothetical protein